MGLYDIACFHYESWLALTKYNVNFFKKYLSRDFIMITKIHCVGIIIFKTPYRVYGKSTSVLYAHDKTLRSYLVINAEFEITTRIIFNISITIKYLWYGKILMTMILALSKYVLP